MFGIGTGELLMIALVVLIAVGPAKMPILMRTIGKGMRDIRKATSDLRKQAGIDELLREDVLGVQALQRELRAPVAKREQRLTADDRITEAPPEGVDLALARRQLAAAAEAAALAHDNDDSPGESS